MISRVVSVGFVLLFAALAGAPGSASPLPCAEAANASDEVTELAMGVARAFGSKATKGDVQKEQSEPFACSMQGADEVVIVNAG